MDFNKLKNITPIKRRVFHPYFTSQPHSIVAEYIKFFTKENEVVLDSFIGSGVTLLESRLLKRNSIGIDLSPFACFISKVSTSQHSNLELINTEFDKIKKDISNEITSLYDTDILPIFKKKKWAPANVSLPSNADVKNMHDLFTKRNLEALTILINKINAIKDENIKELFRGIFSGLLHRASRTFFYDKLNWGGGNSSIFTKYRYWVPKNPNERNVWELFETRYKRILSLLEKTNATFSKDYVPRIYNESATELSSVVSHSVDYVYIDPPYGGNISYLDLSTIWLAWLDLPIASNKMKLEVIEGGDIKNSKDDYTDLLKESIKELYRVLKDGKYLSIAFSHKDLSYWYQILTGCETVGFQYVNTIYYSPYYKSFQKVRNPLTTLTGQMILNFKKVKHPQKINKNIEIVNIEGYIIDKIEEILKLKGDSKTEEVFNELLPILLEKGVLKKRHTAVNVVKLLSDNFLYNSTNNSWTNKASVIDEIAKSIGEIKYNQIIFYFPNINSENEFIRIDNLIEKLYNSLDSKGSLWICCDHKITSKKILPIPFMLCERFQQKGFFVQNSIIWPHLIEKRFLFKDFHSYCLFFTKEAKNYNFNKDSIREKPIWKDIEWGKRSHRYNEKGKDPGNVWMPTEDDGKGKITKHLILTKNEVYERIMSTSENNSRVLFISDNKFESKIIRLNKINIDFILYENSNDISSKLDLTIKNKVPVANGNINTSYKVIFHSSENMKEIKDKTINLIVTSPPYWDLKDYKSGNQIGYKEDYHQYLERLKKVWLECKRTLKDNGTLWININSRKVEGKYYGIHYDFIKYLNQIGLNLIDIVIWHKSSSIPVGEGNLKDNFEYILGFSKSNIKQITIDNIDFKDYFNNGIPPTTLNMWNMNRISGSLTKGLPHPAMFPEELPKRLIQCLTSEGDVVLDPFLGSGSTMAASIELNRSCVGYELNKDYLKIIKTKISVAKQGLFSSNSNIEFIES